MYDIDTKNVKKGKLFFSIFFFVGLLFLIIMCCFGIPVIVKYKSLDSSIISSRVEVNSYLNSENEFMYSPTYYYKVNETIYSCKSITSSNINPGTDNKTVYYDSKNPSDCITEYSLSILKVMVLFLILPISFIVCSVVGMIKTNRRVKKIMELNQKGKLVKNLPYRLVETGRIVNNVPIMMPVVDYVLPSGQTVMLKGDARHDRKTSDADGMVDLLIDESNPSNYFIDFEINRLSGNLPQDYYQH